MFRTNVRSDDRPTMNNFKGGPDKICLSSELIKNDGLTFIKVLHQYMPVFALIDKGSTTSVAGPKLIEQFSYLEQQMSQHRGEAITVCSSRFEFSGMLPFAFNIEERQFENNFYIDTMPYSVLLGSNS